MNPTVRVLPGDVLLGGGSSPLGRQIMRLTQAPVSHAAVVLEDGSVLQATPDTLAPRQTGPIPTPTHLTAWSEQLASHDFDQIYVLRYEGFLCGQDAAPVLRRARAISGEGHSYAADRLLLIALHCLTVRLHVDDRPATQDYFERALAELADHHTAVPALVCSELVVRVFLEAAPDCAYPIDLDPRARLAPRPSSPSRIAELDVDTDSDADTDSEDGRVTAEMIAAVLVAQAEKGSALGDGLPPSGPLTGLDDAGRDRSELVVDGLFHLPGMPDVARRFLDAYLARSTARPSSRIVLPHEPIRPSPYLCGLVPAFITPADLFFSPSFRHIGSAHPLQLTGESDMHAN